MLLRIRDTGSKSRSKSRRKPKLTKADKEALAAFEKMQTKLDALPKFSLTYGSKSRPQTKPKAGTKTQLGTKDQVNIPVLTSPPGRQTAKVPSRNAAEDAASSALGLGAYKPSPKYTGTKMRGISVLHKSNGIPVFSDEEIKDIAKMRR